jgi:hypothetical protein
LWYETSTFMACEGLAYCIWHHGQYADETEFEFVENSGTPTRTHRIPGGRTLPPLSAGRSSKLFFPLPFFQVTPPLSSSSSPKKIPPRLGPADVSRSVARDISARLPRDFSLFRLRRRGAVGVLTGVQAREGGRSQLRRRRVRPGLPVAATAHVGPSRPSRAAV